MTRRCVGLLFVFHVLPVLSLHPTAHLMRREISRWCKKHPFGRIYSRGIFFVCSHEFQDWEEQQIKNLRMRNIRLRVGMIPDKEGYDYDCEGYYDEDVFKMRQTYSRYLLDLLQEILGFKVQFVTTDTWGAFDTARNNWTGLVGLVKSHVIDLGICHPTITEHREDEVDFLLSTLCSTRAFVYDTNRLPLPRDVFVSTFPPSLWRCFFASIALLVVCFKFSTWQHSKLRPDHEPWSWIEVMMWANAAVCQQSYSRHPKGSSCRTTFLIGYMITYLLYTGFAAGVTSLLAVQGHNTYLGFMNILSMKSKLVLLADGTHFDFLKYSPDADARFLFSSTHRELQRNKVGTLRELFEKLNGDNFVGLGTTVTLLNYMRKKIPAERAADFTLAQIPNTLHQKAFVMQKNSPFKEIFNYWLLRLIETGLVDLGIKKYISTEDVAVYQHIGWSSADLANVFSSVIIWAGGLLFSVIILFVEMAWKKKSIREERDLSKRMDVQTRLMGKKLVRFKKEAGVFR